MRLGTINHVIYLGQSQFFSEINILIMFTIIIIKSKGELLPRSYPIQCERKWKYSFLSVGHEEADAVSPPHCPKSTRTKVEQRNDPIKIKSSDARSSELGLANAEGKPVKKTFKIWRTAVWETGVSLGIMWAQLRRSLRPPVDHSIIVMGGSRGALNGGTNIPRHASLSQEFLQR